VDDVAGMALWALVNESVRGPLNAVGPEPARNLDFTKTLARAVRRPAVFPAPAFLLRLALGGLSHVMLDSIRAAPAAALRGGYAFRYPTLEANLQAAAAGL
jgi:NAD dependent epimerase/dehydratase family enzyme